MENLTFSFVRNQIVGIDAFFETPFGKRLMVYCDYTASGRCLSFIESYIMRLQRNYANTHTEDDITGRNMSLILHQAEDRIKKSVNASANGKFIACGNGSTAAIDKFQQILGVRLPPATANLLFPLFLAYLPEKSPDSEKDFAGFLKKHQPVVFLGEYEHHSNELTWREGVATVVKVPLNDEGEIDLLELEILLKDSEYEGRLRIGSFSAASNVTGIISPVHKIAVLLHKYNALACFDYAASAPYVPIDMSPPSRADEDPSIDAVFISPHKFIGGPGSVGVLVFKEQLYNRHIPPTSSGGGTVEYVGLENHDYLEDIEEREKAGTPGVLQTMKAALAFMVKDSFSPGEIEKRETEYLLRGFDVWRKNPRIQILGNPDPQKRIPIVSFMIKDPWNRSLHPKFVTALLNDLFGIQSRAGCSCAGPYGHSLLEISPAKSERYREAVKKGYGGVKPGWCRIGFHYVMDDAEVNYIIECIDFVGRAGYLFLPLYKFDLSTGVWNYLGWEEEHDSFDLESALKICEKEPAELSRDIRKRLYRSFLDEAEGKAALLKSKGPVTLKAFENDDLADLQFFSVPTESLK